MTVVESSPFVRVERRNTAVEVRDQLIALIRAGTLRVNEKLPPEMELARNFGVSRPVVREALVSLQALGLVASQNGKGTYVIADRPQAPLLLGRYSTGHLNAVRRYLEVPAATLAAERRTEAQLAHMTDVLAQMQDCDNPGRRNILDAEFHIAIAEAAGNPLLKKLVEDLRAMLEAHSLAAAAAPNRRSGAMAEHLGILDAIRRGDGGAAGAAMANHLDAADNAFVILAG